MRFRIAGLMGLVGVAAMVCSRPAWLAPAGVAVGVAFARARGPAGSDLRRRLALAALAVYAPCVAGWFVLDCGHCTATWTTLFPGIPGLLPALLALRALGVSGVDDGAVFAAASALTLALIALLTWAAGLFRRVRAVVWLAGLLWSAAATTVAISLLRA